MWQRVKNPISKKLIIPNTIPNTIPQLSTKDNVHNTGLARKHIEANTLPMIRNIILIVVFIFQY